MARGGKRQGAGRPKGSVNRMSSAAREAAQASGITPLDYMLSVLRTATDPALRMDAAKAAAPYVHPRLSQVDGTFKHRHERAEALTDDELASIAAEGRAGAAAAPVDPGQLN